MVIETTVVSNKTGVPDAIVLEVELQMGPDLSYIISQHVGLLNKSAEASTGILETKSYQATSLTELHPLYLGYDQPVWTLSKRSLLVSI